MGKEMSYKVTVTCLYGVKVADCTTGKFGFDFRPGGYIFASELRNGVTPTQPPVKG